VKVHQFKNNVGLLPSLRRCLLT